MLTINKATCAWCGARLYLPDEMRDEIMGCSCTKSIRHKSDESGEG